MRTTAFQVLSSLFYITIVGVCITIGLVAGIWAIGKVSVESTYLSLDDRATFAATYSRLDSAEKRLSYLRSQAGFAEPFIKVTTTYADTCGAYFKDFESYIAKANAVLSKYGAEKVPFDTAALSPTDLSRVDVFTATAFEMASRFNKCANK